jgi:hypothetical protein
MSHFAKVINGTVTKVIVATQAEINSEKHGDAFLWVQTSYNNNFRKNFACIGMVYDSNRDAFIAPPPLDTSWILNEDTCRWEPPVAYPTDGLTYTWDEATTNWKEIE